MVGMTITPLAIRNDGILPKTDLGGQESQCLLVANLHSVIWDASMRDKRTTQYSHRQDTCSKRAFGSNDAASAALCTIGARKSCPLHYRCQEELPSAL
jgi:hypothetical protein